MHRKLVHISLIMLVSLLASGQARAAYLAAYWDALYPAAWSGENEVHTYLRDSFEAAGYEILDAEGLKKWMDARIADGASSVVVFCKDVVPDTVAESNSSSCTLRQYLDAGGKIVWYSDMPMFYQGHSDGSTTGWNESGMANILDIPGTSWQNTTNTVVTFTDEGIEWGLTETWTSTRWTPTDETFTILAVDGSGNAAAYAKHFLPGDTSAGFVRIWDVDVTATNRPSFEDVQRVAEYGLGGNPYPRRPSPADGALHADTWVTLSWFAGDFAVSHDVYLGDNFEDVNDATTDSGAFRGNQASTYFVAGFPGFPYPDGLVPGTTYYWRIDEVNDADPNSPWRGPVWSFTIPSKKAYDPVPADNAKFVDPDGLTLRWTGGFGSKLHTVYFGDNFDDVNNAAGGLPQGLATYTPAGPLEPETTYYWRVDEFDAVTTHKGDIWNFTVAKEGGGIRGDYYKGMNFESFVLTRIDPQIDFSWAAGEPDPAVGADGFSVRWTGEVEAAFTETYRFYARADDGVRLWVDGIQLVNAWIDQGATEYSGELDLIAGNTYGVVMEMYENGGDAVAELRWSSPSTPKQIIPQAALSLLAKANSPKPTSGTVGVNLMSDLTWRPGSFAASHDVYFGTDADAVANATTASPEYKGSEALGDESYDPGKLAWDTTYYWRIDEVNNTNPDSPWKGNLWNFNSGAFLVVDDFESYDDIDPAPGEPGLNRIFDKWIDGFGTTDNGALVGNDLPPYAEQTIVNSGAQSMIYRYDNAGKTSEATLTLVYPRDWTEEGVIKLSLWFQGDSANAADRIYVALNGTAVVYHDDAAATQLTGWNEWVTDLQAFTGVNLTNVNTISIGIGTKNSPSATGGAGTMYFDDIRLYR